MEAVARNSMETPMTQETVFIGSDRSPQYGDAYLYALENHTGKLRWKHAVHGQIFIKMARTCSS
jgi:outer membrane protein assembly factor BamB